MRLDRFRLELLCGMLLTLAALPVFSQDSAPKAPEFNKQALRNFGDTFLRKAESGAVDLKAPFLLEVRGTLTDAGKIDPATVKFPREEGDPKLIEIAKEAIGAVSDSGFLHFLGSLGAKDTAVVLEQNDADFSTLISFALPSESRARTVKSAMDSMLTIGRLQLEAKHRDAGINSEDELLLLRGTSVSADVKNVIVSTRVPKSDFHEMIARQLKKHAAKTSR